MVERRFAGWGLAALLLLPACRSQFKVPPAWNLGGQTAAYHKGPLVAAGETGPRRFLLPLLEHLPQADGLGLDAVGWQGSDAASGALEWRFPGSGPLQDQAVVLGAQAGGRAAEVLLRLAHAYGSAVAADQIPNPSRSLLIQLTGASGEQDALFTRQDVLAYLVLQDAIEGPCALWRSPDPGGADSGVPANGLNLVMRLALVDVGMACRPWKSAEFAYDGGPEHHALYPDAVPRIYLAVGDSGVDLSRTDQPGVGEAERAGLAIWAGAAALAGARGTDLDRYLSSFLLEARLRHYEGGQLGQPAGPWQAWLRGARLWLRAVVLGLPVGQDSQ